MAGFEDLCTVKQTTLAGIADAIRKRTAAGGGAADGVTYAPSQMPQAIRAIPGGGGGGIQVIFGDVRFEGAVIAAPEVIFGEYEEVE